MLPPFPLVTAQPIDASGVNLGDWFADWGEGYGPPAAGKQGELEQQYGAWGVDFTYTGNWGVKDKRALTVAVEQQVKGITLSATGELDLDVNVGFVPEIKFGFDVHTPIDVWNSYLNYMRFSAGGTFYADAIVDAVLTIAAKASVSAAQLAEAKSTVKKSMPMPKSKSPKFKLGMIGPFAGPSLGPVPTTFLVEFVAACEVTTYATIKANMEGHVKAGATFGFDYERGKGLSFPLNTTFEKSASFTFLSGEGGVLAECTFGPRLQWKIADIGGPYVDGHAGAQADLIYKSECPPSSKVPKSGAPPATIAAEARVGIVVGFGGEIEIGKWGITLWEYDFGSMTLVNEWWKLWGKVWDVGYGLGSCASDCEDKIRNNAEGDVDCGGICPKKCPAGSSCFAVSDCPAGLNCNLGKCSTLNSSDPCNDGVRGTGELDVDCGGKCPKCKLGQMCFKNDDCLSGMCPPIGGGGASQCAAWDCNNGVQEKGAETDVDCGAECTKAWPYRGCGSGKHCLVDKDCDAGICMWMGYRDGKDKPVDPLPVELSAPQRYCVPPDCDHMANGVKDDGTGFVVKETGIDCGGGCVDIINPPNSGTCLTKNLEDLTEIERISGYQTKLACGKDYLRCRYLGGCKTGADCMSGYCGPTGLCGVPPCVNGFADFAEGDVDCGGPCKAKCDALSRCKADSDCKPDWAGNPMTCSNWDWDVPNAFGGQKVCRPFDANGVFDPLLESDVDCGWQSAKKCKVGQNCGRPEYCEAGLACVAKPFFDGGVCTAVGTCSDGKKTDYETDVDCGGTRWCPDCAGYCPRCADGKGCWLNEHCKSGKCVGAQSPGPGPGTPFKMGTCASSCENGVIDAADGEGDVDCGGPKCANKCRAGWKCKSNDQCKTGFCLSGKCSISTCDDGLQLGTETDVDCGGGCAKCAKGRKCGVNADCISWVCNASKVCAAGTCDNGKLDVGETDVDCGGPCGPTCKPAAACTGTGDCASGQCTGGKCACATGSYRDAATGACLLCACRLAGSTGSACDATGQCSCKPDWTGAKCDAFIGSCGPGACPVTPCRNPGLDTPWRFDSGPGSSDAAAADFDGDALPDLVVTNGPENAIRVFPGRAGGGFKAPRTFPTGPYPIALVVADLDADGRLDVATADYHGSSSTTPAAVSVLLGNGDGTFKPKADYPVVIQANTIAVADVNGDKVLDLVAGNDPSWGVVSGGVSLLLGNGNGTFKARVDVAGLSSPIALGDANGDGRADLASRAYGNFGVSIANANGTFQGAKAVPLTPNAFALADMNGDKRADLVATVSGTPGSVRVLLAGTSATTPFQGDGASYPATAYDGVTLSDLDGDGVQDVLLRGQNGLQVLTG
ncbi:MAG: VCBS repeat-containing protein, partial [Deltaproteobacteria bacterium]|nr:VCBS repeat-containing protein [Deltaproteobacteria bacterium]